MIFSLLWKRIWNTITKTSKNKFKLYRNYPHNYNSRKPINNLFWIPKNFIQSSVLVVEPIPWKKMYFLGYCFFFLIKLLQEIISSALLEMFKTSIWLLLIYFSQDWIKIPISMSYRQFTGFYSNLFCKSIIFLAFVFLSLEISNFNLVKR
jgi:hypothetical protein